MKKETLHVVAFLDLLGASEIMKDNTESENVLNKITELFELVQEKWIKQLEKEEFVPIKNAIFSDNIAFAME